MYMKNLYIVEDKKITDFKKIEEYNEDFKRNNPSFKPFITKDSFETFLKEVEEKKTRNRKQWYKRNILLVYGR